MATFSLYIGEPAGKKLLDKKLRSRAPDAAVGLDSGLVHDLGLPHDPYRDETWCGQALEQLADQFEHVFASLREALLLRIRQKANKETIEPWMEQMLEVEEERDALFQKANRLLALVLRAQAEEGTIVYWGD